MTLDGQNRKEAKQLRLLSSISATKIGTWNVRSMYIPGKAQTIANEMNVYEIGILGIAEARWNDAGQSKPLSREVILYSGHLEENAQHSEGFAIMLSKRSSENTNWMGANKCQNHHGKIQDHTKTRSAKQSASREYTTANKDVRNSARIDKRAFVDKLTAEAEEAARANNIKALYDNIKLLTGKYQKGSRPVKAKKGKHT
ncbi:unnamed protein product [Mytilus coruscus]|uniref:Endonuclease/exonuclease/phosphatase domain-containing protein n=1 Tax=Mytilus coruscus TaxID=42192 RepID=A0A6J8AVA6_MYTCO|nr:unnamed protein product [Mytilus coruscus]